MSARKSAPLAAADMAKLVSRSTTNSVRVPWLHSITINWPAQLCRLLGQEPSAVRILLVEVRGSAPREAGTCMLIGRDQVYGTIGGGALEQHAVDAARAMLSESVDAPARLERLVLGTQLGQCCGGVVQVFIEKFKRTDLPLLLDAAKAVDENLHATLVTSLRGAIVNRRLERNSAAGDSPTFRVVRTADEQTTVRERIDSVAPPLWIFGGGHVGQALVRTLADAPLRITWIDSRPNVLPSDVPPQISAHYAKKPVEFVRDAPAGTRFLIMTHDHALDYELCRAILLRNDFAWLGLIGSKSKGAKFRARLARDSISSDSIARMICPIGVTGIASKWPVAIAIGVAAQLLQTLPAPQTKYRLHAAEVTQPDSMCSTERCSTCTAHEGSL